VIRHDVVDWFAPIEAPLFRDLSQWSGADVVIATGWQTVHPALALDRTSARVYLVNDYEPDFHMASSERVLAEDTYHHGLHCIASSPWLRDRLADRYGATADVFQFGVDHDVYRVRPVARRRDTVVYYARWETARRAVPHGLMALGELHRRRPDLRIALFGTRQQIRTPFPYEHLGVLSTVELSWLYSQATVGLCLSLTNFSLMPQEMMACGLPCVELAGVSAEGIFGDDGPIALAPLDPWLLADSLDQLLDDYSLWEQRSTAGIAFASQQTWDRATDAVEAGIRHALRLREGSD
jgi:glycosyltransferase involved in cell wall biosynthesis